MANVNDLTNPDNWVSVERLNEYHELDKNERDALLDDKQGVFQFTTMPTASADNLGDIVQFTGTTTANYTNGYFYKCVENGGSYEWQNVNVQSSSGGGGGSLPSGGTTGQVLTKKSSADGDADWEDVSGGGSGGASESEIAPVESTSTASQAYAVGDLLIYNGKLYRVTKAIASGGTITPNTNCVETSVSEVFVKKTGDTMTGGLTISESFLNVKSTQHGSIPGLACIIAGKSNTVNNSECIVVGHGNTANGSNSVILGTGCTTNSNLAASEVLIGSGLTGRAKGQQYVFGKYNNNSNDNLLEIGNGSTSSNRSNALELTDDGNLTVAGTITDGSGNTLSNVNGNIAVVEASSTASKAYSTGDYIIFGGQLYRVTSAIASGGTITTTGASANVTATTVTDELGSGGSGGDIGKQVTSTVNGTALKFSDSSITSTSVIDGPYILDGWVSIEAVTYDAQDNSVTYTLGDSSADTKSAIIYVR